MLNKHKDTKTLSNSPWCEDTKVLAEESLCLQFSGVALRVFVSLCLIVLWFFVELTLIIIINGEKTLSEVKFFILNSSFLIFICTFAPSKVN